MRDQEPYGGFLGLAQPWRLVGVGLDPESAEPKGTAWVEPVPQPGPYEPTSSRNRLPFKHILGRAAPPSFPTPNFQKLAAA